MIEFHPDRLNVLIACEESGVFRDAFIRRGHNAISCDLIPTSSPGPHHQGDVREILQLEWDLIIAHPVCRYLTNSGALHLYQGKRRWNSDGSQNPMDLDRVEKCVSGARFFVECLNGNAPCVAVENPVMHDLAKKLTWSGHPQQTVQPWHFGEKAFKATTFRLKNLPPLIDTNRLTPPKKKEDPEEHKNWSFIHRTPPGPDREKIRSRSFVGIADAAAKQWGDHAYKVKFNKDYKP